MLDSGPPNPRRAGSHEGAAKPSASGPGAPGSARRVLLMAPTVPEKSAYALARYSRSPDSVTDSLAWVRSHSSQKFLDTFYFRYGHASIADLGHLACCFEGVSELAAAEIVDEQLWDGQAKSSRYQDFSKSNVIVPEELRGTTALGVYEQAARDLGAAYLELHAAMRDHLTERHPRPAGMKSAAYRRTIDARAFDTARYLLLGGVSTNVGQVTSIRTLEKQMRRLGVSAYGEVRSLAREMHRACAAPPACGFEADLPREPVAPTLAKYADPDLARAGALRRVRDWARGNFDPGSYDLPHDVDLVPAAEPLAEIASTWLYAVTHHPFRVVLDTVTGWSRARRMEVVETALEGRNPRDELLRPFHSGYGFVFDIVCDFGAYRDLHRHRRCQQIRQDFPGELGCEYPPHLDEAGVRARYERALRTAASARDAVRRVSEPASHYLLPFATRCRTLFKMDFAEVEYIARVRSGVKGHFSYRKVAWEMRERVLEASPELGRLIRATPPWEEDALAR